MEFASRIGSNPKYLNGLARCIDRDSNMTPVQKAEWQASEDRGLKLFAPDQGGSYEVFNVRPIAEDIRAYCVQDVLFLPGLWSRYRSRLNGTLLDRVEAETKSRVALSQSAAYDGKGPHRALGPWKQF